MLCCKVLVKEEDGEFHNPEVDNEVPEDDRVLRDEHLLCQN